MYDRAPLSLCNIWKNVLFQLLMQTEGALVKMAIDFLLSILFAIVLFFFLPVPFQMCLMDLMLLNNVDGWKTMQIIALAAKVWAKWWVPKWVWHGMILGAPWHDSPLIPLILINSWISSSHQHLPLVPMSIKNITCLAQGHLIRGRGCGRMLHNHCPTHIFVPCFGCP